ncbi:MAG TPA: hypothetical protein VFR03_14145 [Thermoanaerobaculia bacterium]|nr:hypothetical protein [Thermoanaerobaculia bacterium]
MRMPTLRRSGGAFTLLLCIAVPALGQDEPLQAFRDGGALTLVPVENGARIELPGGRALSVALPDRAEVSTLAAIDGGWVAAGSVPDATGGRKLFLLRGNDSAARAMAEPPGQEGKQRRGPVLLVDGGRLAGIAWLEGDGDRALSVRASLWNGKRWQAPERVSFPGPGTQIALAGAVLADGSWLLAWSAFDGQDDEVVWARRQGDAWQPVRRLTNNSVPDIVPALTATADGGALIAWSRFEGTGYQMRMARFGTREGGGWQDDHPAAALGSLYPVFLGPSRLLYLDAAAPRSWTVLDLDAQGRVKARASAPSTLERPAVSFEGNQVRMRWPAAKRQVTAPMERVP